MTQEKVINCMRLPFDLINLEGPLESEATTRWPACENKNPAYPFEQGAFRSGLFAARTSRTGGIPILRESITRRSII